MEKDNNQKFFIQCGNILKSEGKFEEAIEIYKKAILNEKFDHVALFNIGTVLMQQENFDLAKNYFLESISMNQFFAPAYLNLANIHNKFNNKGDALNLCTDALKLKSDYPQALRLRITINSELFKWTEVLEDVKTLILSGEDGIDIQITKAYSFIKLNCIEEATEVLNSLPKKFINDFSLLIKVGNMFKEIGLLDRAVELYNNAILLNENSYIPYYNLGLTFYELREYATAEKYLYKSITFNPKNASSFYNLGIVQVALGKHKAAEKSYRSAILYNKHFSKAYNNLGNILRDNKNLTEALYCYHNVLTIDPKYPFVQGMHFHTKMEMCDWSDFNEEKEFLISKVRDNSILVHPFILSYIVDDPKLLKISTEAYVAEIAPDKPTRNLVCRLKNNKIKIGYFSPDFGEHPVSYLCAELFELHDRKNFEIIAFSIGPVRSDSMTKRLRDAFDQFHDVGSLQDEQIINLSRSINIDIAIDLSGHTKNARPSIFALRVAPIQMNYIGYLGTMGASYYDWLIADSFLISEADEQFYTEKIIRLNCWQVNDSKREFGENIYSRSSFGINADAFVFCCFNNNYKLTPDIFALWMNLLLHVENSVLMIFAENIQAKNNLKQAARKFNIDDNRLIFAERLPRADYLARYSMVDLFLDTFPYNAGATASDALFMGVPVLTRSGRSFSSRAAGSILSAINLPELITHTHKDYFEKAIELATNKGKMMILKKYLACEGKRSKLFNTSAFVSDIEDTYFKVLDFIRQ